MGKGKRLHELNIPMDKLTIWKHVMYKENPVQSCMPISYAILLQTSEAVVEGSKSISISFIDGNWTLMKIGFSVFADFISIQLGV